MTQTHSGERGPELPAQRPAGLMGLPAGLAELGSERVETVTGALDELARLLLDGLGLQQVLQRVAELAVRALGCTGAGVTLLGDGGPWTAAHTADLVLEVDAAQYALDDGPCLTAAREGRRISVDLGEAQQVWPAFAQSARAAGVQGFLAVPLVAGGRGIGALNVYSASGGGFDALQEAIADVFGAQASVALANAQLYGRATALSAQLQEALVGRAVIERAKGALMVTLGLSEQGAFDLLRQRSQDSNTKLRDVAADVLTGSRAADGPHLS